MTTWLSGMEITAERLADGITPVVINTGFAAATGFSLSYFQALISGRAVSLRVDLTRTGTTINADTAGNLGDTTLGTLPSSIFPSDIVEGIVSDGFGDGDANINNGTGVIVLRTWSANGTVQNGRTYRLSAAYNRL